MSRVRRAITGTTGRASVVGIVAVTTALCVMAAGTLASVLLVSHGSRLGQGASGSLAADAEASQPDRSRSEPIRPPEVTRSPPRVTVPTSDEIALLPEARYDAVILDLIDAEHSADVTPDTAYSLLADAPLYGRDRTIPVARLAAVNFLGDPTVVIPVGIDGEWTRVLTPARQQLPSLADGDAAAQTSGWVRTVLLVHPLRLPHRIVVSIGGRTLSILAGEAVVSQFEIGIGTPDTPTPAGVTGYLQARYLDPAQGQAEHRVQLTSLHSSAADEPYGGTDGGLIGIHYSPAAAGTVSHGCIRLSAAAIDAVDALPIGTSITVLA